MKKKIIATFILIFFIIGFLNYNFFVGNFYNYVGNFYSYKRMFFLSIIYHKKANNIIKSDFIIYNLGNDYYKIGSFEQSFDEYKKILTNDLLKYKVFHNIGNLFYRMGEKYPEQNIVFWKNSISYYEDALFLEENIFTRKNYEFVKLKLDNLKEINNLDKNNKNKTDLVFDKKNEKDDVGEIGNNNNNLNTNTLSNQSKTINSNRLDKYKLGNNSTLSEMSIEEKNILNDYEKYLKATEANNQDLFNKNKLSDSNIDNLKNNYSGDPFFDTIFDTGGEKDW